MGSNHIGHQLTQDMSDEYATFENKEQLLEGNMGHELLNSEYFVLLFLYNCRTISNVANCSPNILKEER